jgi:hypothetical protein
MNSLKSWSSIFLAIGVIVTPLLVPVLSIPTSAAAHKTKQQSPVERLASIFRPTRRQNGTRSGSVCLLTPGEILWSDRPLFVWDANVSKITVRTVNQRPVWSQTLMPNHQSIVYQGEPLQAGQTYEVILYDANGERLTRNEQFYPRFTLLEVTRQQKVEVELAQIESQLRANRATTEEIALAKAIYFSEQELWSDALQVIYTIPNPSTETNQFIQTATQNICEESTTIGTR